MKPLFGDSNYVQVCSRRSLISFCFKKSLCVPILLLRFANTALADTSCWFTVVTGVDFQAVILGSSVEMAKMRLSMNAAPRNTYIAKFSTILNSTVVSKLPIGMYFVTSLLALSRSFDSNKSEGCTSFDIVDSQSVGKHSFEIPFRLGSCIEESGYRVHNINFGAN